LVENSLTLQFDQDLHKNAQEAIVYDFRIEPVGMEASVLLDANSVKESILQRESRWVVESESFFLAL
jgi:hypothetical protein